MPNESCHAEARRYEDSASEFNSQII